MDVLESVFQGLNQQFYKIPNEIFIGLLQQWSPKKGITVKPIYNFKCSKS